MTLRANVWANYLNQAYSTFIGLATVPVYLRLMGPEAYGLIGFFTMVQTVFSFLDLGLTHTVTRDTARLHGGGITPAYFHCLIRFVSGVFWSVGIVGGVALFAISGKVASEWLVVKELLIEDVTSCVQLAAGIVALRWLSSFYRGIISGAEDQVWLSWYASVIATLRYLAVIPMLMYVSSSPVVFFAFQLAIGIIELVGFFARAMKIVPTAPIGSKCTLSEIRPSLYFSSAIAISTAVWILATQSDKIILSKVLELGEFGYYSLAVLLAGVIGVVGSPISNAVLPRMVKLLAEGSRNEVIQLYRSSVQTVAVLVGAVACVISLNAEPLLFFWTSDPIAAQSAAPILTLYLAGSSLLALSAYPYYLQYATGNLRLHVRFQCLYAACFIPLVSWAAIHYAGVGAAWVWLGINLAYFATFPMMVHRSEIGRAGVWFYVDVVAIYAVEFAVACIGKFFLGAPGENLWLWFFGVIAVGLCTIGAGSLAMWIRRVTPFEIAVQ